MGKTLKLVSFFSGCGGLDLGLHGGFSYLGQHFPEHGISTVFASDINKAAVETFNRNFKSSEAFQHDILELLALPDQNSPLKPLIDKVDIVAGGFPCQDFSLAGKRGGLNVKRGRLYLALAAAVQKLKPSVFIAENVKGLVTWENGLALKTIIDDFAKLGYRVEHKLMNAADFGVPSSRIRIIIIGIRDDLDGDFIWPEETHSQDGIRKPKWVSAAEALKDLENPEKLNSLPNAGFSKAKHRPGSQGNNKIKADAPAPTMRAEHHGNIEFHYSLERRLSAREAARIQSFPDDFVFVNSTTDAYRQVGNAVAPVFAWHIGKSIQQFLSRQSEGA
jgi:DNA (cytosine-5)-methyltransferase 1